MSPYRALHPDGDFVVLADDEGQQYQISGKLLAVLVARGPLAKPNKVEAQSAHKRRRSPGRSPL